MGGGYYHMDKVICFGKNYQDHMLELGDAAVDKPVIFLKPPSVVHQCPAWGNNINVALTGSETHFECELVIKLCKGGYKLNAEEALEAIGSYTLGLDMTLRKEQALLKENRHPWTTSKVFPDAAIIGPWINVVNMDFLDTEFTFTLDKLLKQKSCGKNMLFNPVELIVYASKHFALCEGDILFTGTPSGVGAVKEDSTGVLQIGQYHYGVNWHKSN